MIDATPLPFDLPAVARKKLTVDFDGGNQSSDAGVLLLRAAEAKIGVVARLAGAVRDKRDPLRVQHTLSEIIGARVFAICCGWEDAIDLNQLRDDPALKMAAVAVPHPVDASAVRCAMSAPIWGGWSPRPAGTIARRSPSASTRPSSSTTTACVGRSG